MTEMPAELADEIEGTVKEGLKEFLCSEGMHNWQPQDFRYVGFIQRGRKCKWCGAEDSHLKSIMDT